MKKLTTLLVMGTLFGLQTFAQGDLQQHCSVHDADATYSLDGASDGTSTGGYVLIREWPNSVVLKRIDGTCNVTTIVPSDTYGNGSHVTDGAVTAKGDSIIYIVSAGGNTTIKVGTATSGFTATNTATIPATGNTYQLLTSKTSYGMSFLEIYWDQGVGYSRIGSVRFNGTTYVTAYSVMGAGLFPAIVSDDNHHYLMYSESIGLIVKRMNNDAALSYNDGSYIEGNPATIIDVTHNDTAITVLYQYPTGGVVKSSVQKNNLTALIGTYSTSIAPTAVSSGRIVGTHITMVNNGHIVKHTPNLVGQIDVVNTMQFDVRQHKDYSISPIRNAGFIMAATGAYNTNYGPIKVILGDTSLHVQDSLYLTDATRTYTRLYKSVKLNDGAFMYLGGSRLDVNGVDERANIWIVKAHLPFATQVSESMKQLTDLMVYPNPANDHITVSASSKIDRITIVNHLGQVIRSLNPGNNKTTINISSLPSGMYIIRTSIGDKTYTTKLVKS